MIPKKNKYMNTISTNMFTRKNLLILLVLIVSFNVFAQEQKAKNTYSQTDIGLKLQLQQEVLI